VKLCRLARARADEELRYSRELLETYNLETGGWLFGQYESGVWVLGVATGLGRDGRRMHERVRLDSSEAERAARDIRLGDSRMRLMGSYKRPPAPPIKVHPMKPQTIVAKPAQGKQDPTTHASRATCP
jgi:hypothetical protein